jgi:gliding motility-associated-like protein
VNEYYIFRIVASTHDSTVTSVSNEIKLAGESIVWIPNAFSPNDDGHNPIFRPTPQFVYLVNDGTYREYEMKIFNRWGEELFQTNNIEEGWDGTYRNKPCESEAYMYHIRVTGLDREIYDKKGMVRLMR